MLSMILQVESEENVAYVKPPLPCVSGTLGLGIGLSVGGIS